MKAEIKYVLMSALLMTTFVCFTLFQQGDLEHTYKTAYALLDGHIKDFYAYTEKTIGGNDYLPAIFFLVAAWGYPLKFFGILDEPGLDWIVLAWNKTLLIFFLIRVSRVANRIYSMINPSYKEDTIFYSILFNPISLFVVVVFSGYDVIGLYFILLGVQSYVQKSYYGFIFWFSIATSFKYFAIAPFVLLLSNKRVSVTQSLLVLLFLLTPIILQFLFYSSDPYFMQSCCRLLLRKSFSEPSNSLLKSTQLAVPLMVYLAVAFVLRANNNAYKAERILPIFLAGISILLLLSATHWHPQWFILTVPFAQILLFKKISSLKKNILDMIGFISYVIVCFFAWPNNVDSEMLNNGVLFKLLNIHLEVHGLNASRELIWCAAIIFTVTNYIPYALNLITTKPNEPPWGIIDAQKTGLLSALILLYLVFLQVSIK